MGTLSFNTETNTSSEMGMCADTRCSANVGVMLCQSPSRWPSNKLTLVGHLEFAVVQPVAHNKFVFNVGRVLW